MNNKFCPNCGTKLVGTEKHCPNCGVALSTSSPMATVSAVSSKKSKRNWLIGGIVAGVIIIAIGVYFMIPKSLSGTYKHSTYSDMLNTRYTYTLRFKDDKYTLTQKETNEYTGTASAKEKGTFTLKKNKVTLNNDEGSSTVATLSKDRKTISLTGFPKFKLDENK